MRWLALLSVALVLSGCVVKSDPSGTNSGSGTVAPSESGTPSSSTSAAPATTATGTSPATTSSPPHAAANATPTQHPPQANLTASAVSGSAPLNVTFALTGSDADGDLLNWTLLYGDGNRTAGSGLPANATHTFALGGNFTVTLTVTDGHANVTRSLVVAVAAAAGGSAPVLDPACQRPDAIDTLTGYYIDDRGSPALGLATGGGTWIYKETNGIPGLQLTQEPGTAPAPLGGASDVDPLAVENHCLGGDELVF